ncbi:MAG: gliding motility protein GldN, partial [Flavobacteriia bacterium]|nr:gliding motility protein GldN [Flavobacteriia bacterium]
RLFSAQIYKATDQFDRDIEDYRYGVDALYEAQKIKETMRTWETDLWHY